MRVGPPALAAAILLLFSIPVIAHHGAVSYDITKILTFKGTVTRVQWMNPHAEIEMDVTDAPGKTQKYTVESISPLSLTRIGWTQNSIKPGDQIVVTGNLSKNGTHIIRLKKIVFPAGNELTIHSGEDYADQ
jgi:hypothetical protein